LEAKDVPEQPKGQFGIRVAFYRTGDVGKKQDLIDIWLKMIGKVMRNWIENVDGFSADSWKFRMFGEFKCARLSHHRARMHAEKG